jgi:hypothetical protein
MPMMNGRLHASSKASTSGRGCVKTTALAISALEFGEKCSLTACQLRFLAEFRLDLAALVTFLHSLCRTISGVAGMVSVWKKEINFPTRRNYFLDIQGQSAVGKAAKTVPT